MTVKAEDRPSGSAGDSASVSTPLFRISVELSLRGVCLSRRSEATPLSYQDKHTPRLQNWINDVFIKVWLVCFYNSKLIYKSEFRLVLFGKKTLKYAIAHIFLRLRRNCLDLSKALWYNFCINC